MIFDRSLGGIGRLYDEDTLLGEVYYNIRQNQTPGEIMSTVVFVGDDLELSPTGGCYRLILEDGRYLIGALSRTRQDGRSPYTHISCDGILHTGST
jgi:hypothetical protein